MARGAQELGEQRVSPRLSRILNAVCAHACFLLRGGPPGMIEWTADRVALSSWRALSAPFCGWWWQTAPDLCS